MKKVRTVFSTIFLVLSLLVPALNTFAQDEPLLIAWTAARTGDKFITNYEVEQYIDRSMLSDFSKSKLFKEANRDYNQYKVLKRKHIYKDQGLIFKKALKKMIYGQMVKKHALQEFRLNEVRNNNRRGGLAGLFGGNNNNQRPVGRQAFNVTERQYMELVRENEDRVLKKYLDQRMGIVKARDKFGDDLKKGDFPHKSSDSNTDIYFRWYKAMKNKLKQDIFDKEVQKWEAIQAVKSNPDLYVRPIEVHDFFKKYESKIQAEVQNQEMSMEEWTELLSKNPQYSILMENTKLLSLGGASLATIRNENPAKFKKLVTEIQQKFAPQLNETLLKKVLDYEQKAKVLANKYPTAEKLWELHKQYDLRADDRSLMLSKLYMLAATIKEGEANRNNTRELLKTEFTKLYQSLKAQLGNEDFYLGKENEKLLFHMLVDAHLKKEGKEVLEAADNYSRRALYMGIWFTKFLASKISFGSKITVKTDICKYNTYECQKKITDWLKLEEYNNGLEEFRTQTLRDYWNGLMTVNPLGRNQMHGTEAVDFVLK